MLPKSYTSPRESTSSGSIFRKLYSCPGQAHIQSPHDMQNQNGPTAAVRSGAPRINSTWLDVVSDDAHVLVAVRTRVLVPEADHVAELVHHNAKLIAVLSYGDGLRAPAPPAHVGATPGGREDRFTSWRVLKKWVLFLCLLYNFKKFWGVLDSLYYFQTWLWPSVFLIDQLKHNTTSRS